MKNKLLVRYVAPLLLGLGLSVSAHALDTLVQLNHDGVAGFDTLAINEFDWQSSGDLVILDDLTGAGSFSTGLGGVTDSFATWAATALPGDVVIFDLKAHARLNDLLDNGGSSVAPATLDRDGAVGGDAGFEITAALDATETALLIAPGILLFTSITGTYSYYIDQTPDSDVATGAGFNNGTNFLSGTVGPTGSPNGTFIFGTGGSSLLRNTVSTYINTIIQTDPAANAPLVGTTFDTLVSLVSSGEASVGAGSFIGQSPYTVLIADLVLKADANTEFSSDVPAPGTLFILGLGLLGLGWSRRKQLPERG